MILYTKAGCIPCGRVKAAIQAAGVEGIEVITKDLSDDSQWEEWKEIRDRHRITLSPALVAPDGVFCGIMAISKRLGIEV